jgi:hypothetical protein
MSEALQRIFSEKEALDWLRQEGGTCLSQCDLARVWGWYEMKVSRRLRAWEEEEIIIRDRGAISVLVLTPITLSNQRDNIPANTPKRGNVIIRFALGGVALVMFGTGLAINARFARSLGSTEVAGWLFLAVGVASDSAAFILPRQAEWLWRERRMLASLLTWALWSVTLAFALIASAGFASLNITDTTLARSMQPSTVEEAALADARAARDRECHRVGPVCRQREETVIERQRKLDEARAKMAAAADPQSRDTSRLIGWAISWATPLRPTDNDLAMVRLALLTLLPQLGGLLLMVARR